MLGEIEQNCLHKFELWMVWFGLCWVSHFAFLCGSDFEGQMVKNSLVLFLGFWPRSHRTGKCSQMLLAKKKKKEHSVANWSVHTALQTTPKEKKNFACKPACASYVNWAIHRIRI